jgi:polysaccharide pyruvyl transferase WcaK-like protein
MISKQDLLITTRAHGILVAAALGMPSVCIGIDPKLHTFHKMLPSASVYVECPVELPKLRKKVNEALELPAYMIKQDFNRKSKEAESSMRLLKDWLLQKYKLSSN